MAAQPLLLFEPICPCGTGPIEVAGRCAPCYRQRWHSLRAFGGYREEVLLRDGHRCRVCGVATRIVHHRAPVQDPARMIALCAGCHAAVHHLLAIKQWVPELLLQLWEEQHPGLPLQLQLPVEQPRVIRTPFGRFPHFNVVTGVVGQPAVR